MLRRAISALLANYFDTDGRTDGHGKVIKRVKREVIVRVGEAESRVVKTPRINIHHLLVPWFRYKAGGFP